MSHETPPAAQLGPYRIETMLGEGGTAVVYRALDTKLNRPVAVKFLSDEVADSAARRRFQREAQMASALNHPHILTVYDAGEVEGRQYLVTEFVDGGTLKTWMHAEERSWRQIVDLLVGVADGLASAHSAGILHRDIKPDNILVAKNGYAKLADFGLAKLLEGVDPDPGMRTVTAGHTRPGVVMGTIAYMSPEQASGRPIDARSDIFSFGVVLYEMLAGRRPFEGANSLEVMQTIIHGEAPALGPKIPLALRMVVEKALEKDPAERYQTMRDMVVDLRRLARVKSEQTAAVAPVPQRWRPGWTLVVAAALGSGLAAWLMRGQLERPRPRQIVQVQRLTDLPGLEQTPAISPDGKSVAFVAVTGGRRQIWVRLLAGGTPLAITKDELDKEGPRWSPDSASVIYYTSSPQPGNPGTLWEVPALGGPPSRMMNAVGPADPSHDGNTLAFFRVREGAIELAVAPRDLSRTRIVARLPGGASYSNPRWSPDDRRIAFQQDRGTAFSSELMLVDASGGSPRNIANDFIAQGFCWMLDGSGLVVSSAQGSTMQYPPTFSLWAVPLNGDAPAQLTFGESSYESPDTDARGNLVVSRVRAQSDVWKFPVDGEPADNARRGVRITHQTGQVQTLSVSPDESEVVFLSDNGGHANVWVARTADGEMRPITRESNPRVVVAVPAWSPRGDLINFLSNKNVRTTDVTLWLVKPDGSDARDLRTPGVWVCWAASGQWIYFSDLDKGVFRIQKMPVGGGTPVQVRDDNAIACAAAPDGSALYYAKILTQASGASDLEIRAAKPENGPSEPIGRVSGSRVPIGMFNFQPYVSPDGKWLAMPLMDGSTTNLWALSPANGKWRKLTDFGPTNVMISRRIGWSKDGKYLYASVSDVDSDVVMLSGLRW